MGVRPITSVIVLAAFASTCTFDRKPLSDGDQHPLEGPDRESWEVEMVISHVPRLSTESLKRLSITAPHVKHYDTADPAYQILGGGEVRFVLFDLEGDTAAVVTAASATYYDHEQRFRASGNVEVKTSSNTLLGTETLSWSEREAKLTTDAFVRITTPREEIEGFGMIADEDMSSYQIGRFVARMETDS